MKKIITFLLALAMLISLVACGTGGSSGNTAGGVEVSFWSAPNQQQFDFWQAKAAAFNETKHEIDGKPVTVAVQQMPETPSSEAGIQNAIVTGTVPAASENINVSFASVLAESDAVYSLQDEEWFKGVLANRTITSDMLSGWEIGGNQYVLPLFINAMSYQWNAKALTALGFDTAPTTVEEFDAVIAAFLENREGSMAELGVTHTFYRPALVRGDQWWERWYDFQMQYMSFSGGTTMVEGDELVMDAEAAQKTFEFYGKLGNTIMTGEITPLWTEDVVPVLFGISAPWEVNQLNEAGKVFGEDYIYGPTLVENKGDTAYSFADSKGIVFYKNTAISEEQHQGAVDFVSWVYSAENATQSDVDFWTTANMMPVRSDLNTNSAFAEIMEGTPAYKGIAEFVPYAIPSMSHSKMTDMLTAFGDEGVAPYFLEVAKVEPLNAPDASSYVEAAMAAMKEVGGLN